MPRPGVPPAPPLLAPPLLAPPLLAPPLLAPPLIVPPLLLLPPAAAPLEPVVSSSKRTSDLPPHASATAAFSSAAITSVLSTCIAVPESVMRDVRPRYQASTTPAKRLRS
jgi:hypothetical protein